MGLTSNGFPLKQLIILALCRFVEPIVFESIQSYGPAMVRDLLSLSSPDHSLPDSVNVSFLAALLASIYAGAEGLTVVAWGSLSDRIGRKPVCLAGLAGVGLSCLLVGFARSYWVVILGRFLGGALNGNVAVMETMVMELVTKPEHQPRAYAALPFVWTVGTIFGASMGGYLARPADFYPDIFPKDGLFGRYPYLLPNLACVVLVTFAVVGGYFFLEETNPIVRAKAKADTAVAIFHEVNDITDITDVTITDATDITETTPLFRPDGNAAGNDCKANSAIRTTEGSSSDTDSAITNDAPPFVFSRHLIMTILGNTNKSATLMAMWTMVPIFLLDKPSPATPDLTGGLGFSLHTVGNFMTLNAFAVLLLQGVIVPEFIERLGMRRSFIFACFAWPLPFLLPPVVHALLQRGSADAQFTILYFTLQIPHFCGLVLNPIYMVLLKAACGTRTDILGTVNGWCQFAACLSKLVAPPLVGLIYDTCGSAAAWATLSLMAGVSLVLMLFTPGGEYGEPKSGQTVDEEAS